MKLIECYVENFGKLKDFRSSFSDGLNLFREDNGFGKTTLSVFIKAMLFGLDDTKKTKLEENDRKHYMPWQGGRCGGSLTFSIKKKTYRIERTFGMKAADDTFILYDCDTGKQSDDYSENLGEELFGIDSDGFERTVFLSERKLSVKNDNKSISAKLSDLVGSDGDVGELDKAVAALEERRKYYHKKGGAGKITDIKNQISAIEAEISRIERLKDGYSEKNEKLKTVTNELRSLEERKRDSEKKRHALGYEKQYLAMKKRKEENEARLNELSQFFKRGTASVEEIRAAERNWDEYNRLKNSLSPEREFSDTDFSDAELNRHIETAQKNAVSKNVNKSSHIWAFLSILSILLGIVLGYFVSPILYTVCAFCLIFAFLSVLNLKAYKKARACDKKLSPAIKFAENVLNRAVEKDNLYAALMEIKAKESARREMILKKGEEEKARAERIEALGILHNQFVSRFPVSESDPFAEIRAKLTEYEYLLREIKESDGAIISYIREYGIKTDSLLADTPSDEKDESPEELDYEIRRHRSDAIMLERECRADIEEISSLDELSEKRLELLDAYNNAVRRLETIQLTKEHLAKAKDSLTSKYLGKTKAAFASYLSLLSGEDSNLFTMDTNFALLRSEGGKSVSGEAYSLGTRELYSLITRFALTDSLYEDEKPFIILDDPFAHFDDKKATAALKLLKKLSETKQIIYFTCSKSRSV